jgi:hypothetical protein
MQKSWVKKAVVYGIIISFIITNIIPSIGGLEIARLSCDIKKNNNINQKRDVFTHSVFAESVVSTTCNFCVFADDALKNICSEGKYPFYYLTLVENKNVHAYDRMLEYNVGFVPDVFFDGGYIVKLGATSVPSAQAAYNNSITQCGVRTTRDIDVTLDVTWLGNATMNIIVSIHNNEAIQYEGRIRVYVTEAISTMGWNDTDGNPYTFPFLDYAFNENITIAGETAWSNSTVWNGHDHNDGSSTFGNIQYGNIVILAGVFNSEWHQGYSYPPDQYPFDAYYLDGSTGFFVGDNLPPNIPKNPTPPNETTNIDVNVNLSWIGGDPNPGDLVTQDVYFGATNPPAKVSSNQSVATYNPGILENETCYYWKIVAWDNHGQSTEGPIWQFTTKKQNSPPEKPSISGPASGKAGIAYPYTFTSTDPDGDQVSYYIEWGDETTTTWTEFRPPGSPGYSESHSWNTQGTYIIQAKVKDVHGNESDWETLSVTMPCSYIIQLIQFWNRLFERFPNAFPIFRYLLRY